MKQLAYLIGEKDFQKGLQNYFSKYAYKNADLNDFMGALAEKSHQDISQWAAQWLETQGLDTLAADFTCKDGKFESLHLKVQSATPSALRTHAFQTVFLKFKN